VSAVLEDRPASVASRTGGGVGGLLRGEWVKLASLRSTWLALGGALVVMVLLGWLFTGTAETGGPSGNGGGPPGLSFADPVGLSLAGYRLAQLAIGVVGVLLVTGEYTSGTVRATFAAVPRRWPVVAAKATVFAVLVALASGVTAVVAFLVGQSVSGDLGASLTDPGVPRVLVGTALYLTGVGLLGMALGWLLRSTAGAVATVFGIVFLLPVLGALLPSDWGPDLVRWLPGEAGSSVLELVPAPGGFAPWTGFGVFCGELAVLFVLAVVLLRRRDA
jgi:ABC-2 type transport system permease protein